MSKLFLIPTPIGNLNDITFRAVEILGTVDLVLAEDTRQTKKLLNHYNISTPLQSHHMFNEHKNVESICSKILGGQTIALVSDAGTPGISDPGFLLVRTCIENEIPVETLPGPTALIPALVNSGLPSDRFCFEGFLPPKKGRNKRMTGLADERRTMIFYESAIYLGPDRSASVSRELSKMFEENIRGTLSFLAEYYTNKPPKGEIVIVVAGKKD